MRQRELTRDDINHEMRGFLVGFALLKPAEFVVLRITQVAGDISHWQHPKGSESAGSNGF